jgi:hypothetical protein
MKGILRLVPSLTHNVRLDLKRLPATNAATYGVKSNGIVHILTVEMLAYTGQL